MPATVTLDTATARAIAEMLREYDRALVSRVTAVEAALRAALAPQDRDAWQRRRDSAYSRANEVRRERAALIVAIDAAQ